MKAIDLFDSNTPESIPKSTRQLLKEVKGTEHDYEWYPTTDEIVQCIKDDIGEWEHYHPSILDCGAGDGRVLNALTDQGLKYAIEKSAPLLKSLSKDIFVIGTDFDQQTLIDKQVSIIYSNPPYSVFQQWSEKIIREANSEIIYLVIPSRWKSSAAINDAIELRNASIEVIGEFDFLEADRVARAKVDVIKIKLSKSNNTEPFQLWFDDNFSVNVPNTEKLDYVKVMEEAEKLESNVNELVKGDNLIPVLEELYLRDMSELMDTYKALCKMNPAILAEMDVSLDKVQGGLKKRIQGLKNTYWNELFNGLHKITDRLTASSRREMLSTLTRNTGVDFSASNAYAIVIWAIKNSNEYFDDQLISTMVKLTQKANVQLYKSNQKTFSMDGWRYATEIPYDFKKYKLDYRIVLEDAGGFEAGDKGKLTVRGAEMFDDLRSVAATIGFDTLDCGDSSSFEWFSGEKKEFMFFNHTTGKKDILFTAKSYKKGTLHIAMNKDFICKLNVEFGRLKGWLKGPKEAAEELDITFAQAAESFSSVTKIEGSSLLKLELHAV